MTLDDLTRATYSFLKPRAFAVYGPGGLVSQAEEVGERKKYERDGAAFAREFDRYVARVGHDLLRYLGRQPARYMRKKFGGRGVVRLSGSSGRVVAATLPALGWVVGNGEGLGFTDGIDAIMNETKLSYSEALERVLSHELTHFAGHHGEAACDYAVYRYYSDRARTTKDPVKRKRYQRIAGVAYQRYQRYSGKSHQHIAAKKIKRTAAQNTKRPRTAA